MTVIPFFIAPARIIRKVFIHCSASDNPEHDNVETVRKWHTSPSPTDSSKPWQDIGYHYYINKNGDIEAGRSLEKNPAAQAGYNTGTIAICCGGLKDFTEKQFDALRELCSVINETLPAVTFHGHCEVNPHKTCPVFSYKKVLGLDEDGRMKT